MIPGLSQANDRMANEGRVLYDFASSIELVSATVPDGRDDAIATDPGHLGVAALYNGQVITEMMYGSTPITDWILN